MTDILARLSVAEAGSRELDALVGSQLEPTVFHGPAITPRYSTSLDAALALAERVLPGWRRHLNELPPSTGLGWEATVWTDAADLSVHPSRAPTPALALCIAILKATHKAEGAEG